MISAETAYNIIESLDKKQRPRLFEMLGVHTIKMKRKPIISDAESREKLIKLLTK